MSWLTAAALAPVGVGVAAALYGRFKGVDGSALYVVCGIAVGMGVFVSGHARMSSPAPEQDVDDGTITIMPWDVIVDGETGRVIKSPSGGLLQKDEKTTPPPD